MDLAKNEKNPLTTERKRFVSVFVKMKNISAGCSTGQQAVETLLSHSKLLRQFLLSVSAVENILEEKTKRHDFSASC
jgi:hypothetical protein